jgi:putative AlgH/UPF0301 family transcriptional regulator
MSVRKLRFFTMLATIAAFVAVEGLNVQIKGFDVPNSCQNDPALAPHASLWYMRQSANPLSRQTILLPIQFKNAKDLGAGKLLVASRGLTDPNFAKTVILLVHYDAEGVVGLMLNRRTDVPLSRVLEGLKAAKDRSDPVYLGGPVETPAVFALLQSPAKLEGAEHIFGSVYLISTKTLFEQTVSKQPDPGAFHVYLGYAGWNTSQLRKEVELGAWFIFQGDAKTVFDSQPDSLWPRMIEKTELQLAHKLAGKSAQSDIPALVFSEIYTVNCLINSWGRLSRLTFSSLYPDRVSNLSKPSCATYENPPERQQSHLYLRASP